jgi:hypothetical protein
MSPAPTKRKPKIKILQLVGRRWFQRGPGNTYHSVEIWINGVHAHRIPFSYGYGEGYQQSAFAWLEAEGYLTLERYERSGGVEAPFRAAQRLGFTFNSTCSDVGRKKDL